MDDPTLPPPWAVMGPEDVCVLVCRDAQDAAAHQAACAQKRGAAVALVTAAGIRLPPSPGDGCALVLPGPQVLWPILVFGMLLALD
jgi:hypothetical protein